MTTYALRFYLVERLTVSGVETQEVECSDYIDACNRVDALNGKQVDGTLYRLASVPPRLVYNPPVVV